MGMIDNSSPITIGPLLLRNLVAPMFIYADKSFLALADKYKVLEFIRYILLTSFVFFLRLIASFIPSSLNSDQYGVQNTFKSSKTDNYFPSAATCGGHVGGGDVCGGGGGDSGISRALSQLLSTVTDIPVSSRKYEVVRSLAERVIDDNQRENITALREVNRTALSAAFKRTLSQLEAAMVELNNDRDDEIGGGCSFYKRVQNRLNPVLKVVRSMANRALLSPRQIVNRPGWGFSAEKLAAELLWLVQKMAACGFGDEAVERWASASHLAWLALTTEPRLQGSLVKVSAFMFKQAKEMGLEETEDAQKEQNRQTKRQMLMSWLPLLCRASNGTDAPVLSIAERAELERILEETIEMLGEGEEQEKVLSLWLQHYTYCPSSDWPNLHATYARWCTASRRLFLLQ